MKKLLLIIFILINSCGPKEWREASTSKTPNEVSTQLADLEKVAQFEGEDAGLFRKALELARAEGTFIYYADAPGDMGPIHTIAPIDYTLFDDIRVQRHEDLKSIRVYFIEGVDDSGHRGALVFDMTTNDDKKVVKSFVNTGVEKLDGGSSLEGDYQITLLGANSKALYVTSQNANGEGPEPYIQLLLETNHQGEFFYKGKISTLIGHE